MGLEGRSLGGASAIPERRDRRERPGRRPSTAKESSALVGAENLRYLGGRSAGRGWLGPALGCRSSRSVQRRDDLRPVGLKLIFLIVSRRPAGTARASPSSCGPGRRGSWRRASSPPACSTAPGSMSWPSPGTAPAASGSWAPPGTPSSPRVVPKARNLLTGLEDTGTRGAVRAARPGRRLHRRVRRSVPGRRRQDCPLRRSGATDEPGHRAADRQLPP